MRVVKVLLLAMLGMLLAACGEPEPKERLTILAGSEARTLEPLLADFTRETRIAVEMRYSGSVDIMLALEQGRDIEADAVWPAHSLWLTLGDRKSVVTRPESIMRSPVIFAVRRNKVRELGWEGRDPSVAEIAEAAAAGRLRFAMTSATQSNSGAMAYLGFLHAFGAKGDVLTAADLDDPETLGKTKALLGSVERSSGSSGWLKDLLLANYDQFDGMVNYEAVMIETNQERPPGSEPLCAVYPRDALTIADHPLALIDRTGAPGYTTKQEAFAALQEWLLSPPVQKRIRDLGRRTGPVGIAMPDVNPDVFNRDWCIDTNRVISPVRLPDEPTIRKALALFQEVLRKPSDTVFLLDVSGSMEGDGIVAMKSAMEALMDPERASRYMVQAAADDRITVIEFSDTLGRALTTQGNDPVGVKAIRMKVQTLAAGGGTDFYPAVEQARALLANSRRDGRLPAVVLLTDGRSEEDGAARLLTELRSRAPAANIPIFAITFGDADPAQLKELAEATAGRVFDGRRDLARAFREVRGYN